MCLREISHLMVHEAASFHPRCKRKRKFEEKPSSSCPSPTGPIGLYKRQRATEAQQNTQRVRFNLDQNKTYFRHLTVEDLGQAWMSAQDIRETKSNAMATVHRFRSDGIFDKPNDSMRGLESRITPDATKSKVFKCKIFRALIMGRQGCSLSGQNVCGDDMVMSLRQLSERFSSEDCCFARAKADMDSKAAAL